MSIRSESVSIDINAPAEVIFAILADPRQHSRIDGSGTVRGCVEGPERLFEGAEFQTSMKMFGAPYKMTNRVVEYADDKLIAWRHFGPQRWRYELATGAGSTSVTETFDYSRASGASRLLIESLRFPARNREGIRQTLVRLKDAAESDASILTA